MCLHLVTPSIFVSVVEYHTYSIGYVMFSIKLFQIQVLLRYPRGLSLPVFIVECSYTKVSVHRIGGNENALVSEFVEQ